MLNEETNVPPSLQPQQPTDHLHAAFAELLRDPRNLRREQQQARQEWSARISKEHKEDLWFELEILLKGLACFANPRNHPGAARKTTSVAVDFAEHLVAAREGMTRAVTLTRSLLGERDRAVVFHRYLETMLPEDGARGRLLQSTLSQETPDSSLFLLRHGFTNLIEVTSGLLRLQRVSFRLFYAHIASAVRETAQSSFFNPLAALEFRPEFDRIPSQHVLELVQAVEGEHAHRLVALAFLALFRMLRYLRLIEAIASDRGGDKRGGKRAYLILAVLRSDARALSSYLTRSVGGLLADGFQKELLRVPASDVATRYDELVAEAHRLVTIKGALVGIAANLRLEMRRTFEHDLPSVDGSVTDAELRQKLRAVVENLRPALQSSILFLGRALGARSEVGAVFDDVAARRATSDRLRRDVWMFAQIVRAFANKARAADPLADRWERVSSFAFVREFLAYFRAMGYPLLRAGDYPRVDSFMAAMSGLEETDLLDPRRLAAAVEESDAFHEFLVDLFERISLRDELAGVAFDRREAAQALRLYLGD